MWSICVHFTMVSINHKTKRIQPLSIHTFLFGHTALCFSVCPLLKCNPDFIWILVPCPNPELILTHFFVLTLNEPEHCGRANRRVDELRVQRKKMSDIYTAATQHLFQMERSRHLRASAGAEWCWNSLTDPNKNVRHLVGLPHPPPTSHSPQ